MSRRKKIVLSLIAVFLILTLLRESGILDIRYYRSTLLSTTHSHWSNNTVTATIDSSIMGTKFKNSLYGELPIVVLSGSDTIYKDENIGFSPVVVTLIKFNPGFLWMPLYKSAGFSAVGAVDFHADLIKTTPGKINTLKSAISGRLTISGHITIKGICSHRHAVELIKSKVAESFAAEAKSYFSRLD